MAYEWDSEKANRNERKHGIRFADAIPALEDENASTVRDDESDPNEERFVTLGMDALGRVLVVVFAYRGVTLRIISARRAEPLECEQYEG